MYFLLDIGGTHLRASFSDGETLGEKKIVDSPDSFEEAMTVIAGLKDAITGGKEVAKVVCGIAGLLEKDKKSLFVSPNLKDWEGKPLSEKLFELFNAEILLENDAALAGLGEATFGAGKDHAIVAYYTIGTGIGGTRIVDKKIDARVYGFEPGHQIITFNKESESQEMLEHFASGSGITVKTGKQPSDIDVPEFWNSISQYIAVGVYNSILHWSPDVFIFGGGVVNSTVIKIEDIEHHLKSLPLQFPQLPVLKKAELGDENGLLGGLALARM